MPRCNGIARGTGTGRDINVASQQEITWSRYLAESLVVYRSTGPDNSKQWCARLRNDNR
jgi:hypothetical protein